MDEPVTVPGIPLALRPLGDPAAWSITGPQALTAVAGPRTDWFVPPDGAGPPVMNAPAIVGAAPGDYLLSARVSVGFGATYDAGVLALHVDERCWAKLCFERAPDGTTLVVSVVTRDVSDDCNSFAVERDHVWLRIARRGPVVRLPRFARRASLAARPPFRPRRGHGARAWLPGPVSDRRGLHRGLRGDRFRGRTARRHPQRFLVRSATRA